MASATAVRRDAIKRLVEICDASWDVGMILRRPNSVQVLLRKALAATKHDDELLAEVFKLWPVATGKTEPLIDAALNGLPDRGTASAPAPTLDELETALARLEATA